jgi:non-specific protein-tyrosine kinase
MGMIPADRSSRRAVVSLAAPQSPSAEAYRSLRTAVYFAGSDRRRRLQVTTPRSRHGKTETVVNLAVAAARAGQRVIVVDCDLRYPRVHELFGLPNQVGFTSVVRGELPLSNALQRVPGVDRVYVLASGPIPTNPAELLASERCHEVLSSLQADGTLVLIDSPPLLVADAATLARSVDGVLLVATAGVTSRKHLRQAIQLLRQIDAPLLGTVLHHADSEEAGGYSEEMGWRQRRRGRRGQPPAAARTPVLREAQEQTAIAAERSGAD